MKKKAYNVRGLDNGMEDELNALVSVERREGVTLLNDKR